MKLASSTGLYFYYECVQAGIIFTLLGAAADEVQQEEKKRKKEGRRKKPE